MCRSVPQDRFLVDVSMQDVKIGAKVQGFVTGFTTYGCFVRFFGDVKGLIHSSALGLGPGKKPADAYEIGQVLLLPSSTAEAFSLEVKFARVL